MEIQWGQRLAETIFPLNIFKINKDYIKAMSRLIILANGFPNLIKAAIISAMAKRIQGT